MIDNYQFILFICEDIRITVVEDSRIYINKIIAFKYRSNFYIFFSIHFIP